MERTIKETYSAPNNQNKRWKKTQGQGINQLQMYKYHYY